MTEQKNLETTAVEEPVAPETPVEDEPMATVADEPMATDEGQATASAEDEPTAPAEAVAEAPNVEAEAADTTATPEAAAADTTAAPEAAATQADAPDAATSEAAATNADAAADEPLAAADAPESEPASAQGAEPAAVAEPASEAAPAPAAPEQTRRAQRAASTDITRGLRERYRDDVIPAMRKQFEYANPNQVPRLDKIVVNIGLGEALTNAKAIDAASGDLTMITGQKPIVMKARRSIAQFRVRTGNPIGLKVTLRGQRMWDFLERLTMLALPRIRDFRGTPSRSFDGRGNYTLGLREQIAFPEIDYDKVDRLRGLEISIVTTAKSDEESKRLLELLGMPFAS